MCFWGFAANKTQRQPLVQGSSRYETSPHIEVSENLTDRVQPHTSMNAPLARWCNAFTTFLVQASCKPSKLSEAVVPATPAVTGG